MIEYLPYIQDVNRKFQFQHMYVSELVVQI